MDLNRIADLLRPFTGEEQLPQLLLQQVDTYVDLLLRWNARINLTAIRDPETIVTRHFGESFFAARLITDCQPSAGSGNTRATTLADVGSGAGFPGIPIKLLLTQFSLTLIESQHKKATFLREVLRALKLDRAEVFCGRAEQWGKQATIVSLRAVEQFERVLPTAMNLVASGGMLCLMIGASQENKAREIGGESWTWEKPARIPRSSDSVVLVGRRA